MEALPLGLNTGRLASAPQKLPTDESGKVAKVLAAQLQGDFHSRSSFRTLGLENEQGHYIISRHRPRFSFQGM